MFFLENSQNFSIFHVIFTNLKGGSKQIIQQTSGGVRAGQNIQLVRSVVSPQSVGKPGATTIMVAPQSGKGAIPSQSVSC